MNSPSMTVGIDVSKQRLDFARFPQGDTFSVAYTDTGLASRYNAFEAGPANHSA